MQRKLLPCWARTGDEDVDEPASGLLPAGFVGGVKDADEGADEVVGIGVVAEIAAGDGALDEGGECVADEGAGTHNEARGATGHSIHCGDDEHFAGDVVDEEKHPGTESFEGWQAGGEAQAGGGQFLDFATIHGLDEGVARWEVAIERAGADAGSACDVVEARGCAHAGEDLLSYLKDALSVALRVGAGFSGGLRYRKLLFRHGNGRRKIFLQPGSVSGYLYTYTATVSVLFGGDADVNWRGRPGQRHNQTGE